MKKSPSPEIHEIERLTNMLSILQQNEHPMKGRHHKIETINKFIQIRNDPKYKEEMKILGFEYGFKKGHVPWNKDKTNIYSEIVLKQIGSGRRGKPSSFKGKHHTEKAKKEQRLAKLGKPGLAGEKNPMYGKKGVLSPVFGRKHTQDEIEKYKSKRVFQIFPLKDSKPERMMQIALALNGIKFEKHKPILGQPDIFIEPNICIFVDGDYWHANPNKYTPDFIMFKNKRGVDVTSVDIQNKDAKINNKLTQRGYYIIRIWESDIRKDIQECVMRILKELK